MDNNGKPIKWSNPFRVDEVNEFVIKLYKTSNKLQDGTADEYYA